MVYDISKVCILLFSTYPRAKYSCGTFLIPYLLYSGNSFENYSGEKIIGLVFLEKDLIESIDTEFFNHKF